MKRILRSEMLAVFNFTLRQLIQLPRYSHVKSRSRQLICKSAAAPDRRPPTISDCDGNEPTMSDAGTITTANAPPFLHEVDSKGVEEFLLLVFPRPSLMT